MISLIDVTFHVLVSYAKAVYTTGLLTLSKVLTIGVALLLLEALTCALESLLACSEDELPCEVVPRGE